MIKAKKVIYFISILVFIQLMYSGTVPIVKAQETIPNSYCQNLNFNDTYI